MSRVIRAQTQYQNVAFFAMTGGMKPPEIRARLERSGRSQIALGRYIGKSKDSVSRLVKGERGLDVEEAEKIAEFFGDDVEPRAQFTQIPVYGYAAAGGDDHISIAGDLVLDRIEVPLGLTRGAAIAIRVAGDSMEPRLYSGELVIVGLGVPPTRNGDCVVELRDGSAIVKLYKGQRDGAVFLAQLNPAQEVRIDASKVKAIHAVLYRR
jgi:phage repressor protein C with HTH and peptisase S24 domain